MKLEQVIEFMPESIRAKISHRTFRPGEFVVRKGERADHVYILTKGTTRVSNEFASGQRYTFAHQTVPDLIGDLDGVLAEFDRVVGLSRLRAVHVNDSKNPCGARKDRHARIGEGYLGSAELGGGEEVFARIVSHPALRDLPFILETPNELPGYAREIELLRSLQTGA